MLPDFAGHKSSTTTAREGSIWKRRRLSDSTRAIGFTMSKAGRVIEGSVKEERGGEPRDCVRTTSQGRISHDYVSSPVAPSTARGVGGGGDEIQSTHLEFTMGTGDEGAAVHEQGGDVLPRIASMPLSQQEVGFMRSLLSRLAATPQSAVTDVASNYREGGEVEVRRVHSGRLGSRSTAASTGSSGRRRSVCVGRKFAAHESGIENWARSTAPRSNDCHGDVSRYDT